MRADMVAVFGRKFVVACIAAVSAMPASTVAFAPSSVLPSGVREHEHGPLRRMPLFLHADYFNYIS